MCSDAEHAMKVLTMCAGQPLSTLAMLRWAVDARAWQPSEQQWRMILAHCLPERERQRCLSYQQADDQKRGVLSQLLQRACISRLLDSATPWQQLPIERTPGGKPFYSGSAARQDAPNLNYNVSHEGDFVVLVSESHCLCGVDVAAPQQLRRGAHSLAEVVELMQPQLTPHEWAHLQSLAHDDAACGAAFQAIWSCKEAHSKARGDGVAFDVSRLEVRLPLQALEQPASASQQQQQQQQLAVQAVQLLLDGQQQPAWRAFLQQLPRQHCVAVVRGPPDAAVDDDGAFTATLRQRHLSPQELRAHLDAPSPPLEVLTVEKLLPAPLLARYIQAAA